MSDNDFPLGLSWKKIVAIVVIIIMLITLAGIVWGMARTVPAGYEGVLLNWGQPIGTLDPGFHWIAPFGQDIYLINVQVQNTSALESAASSDLQEITTSVTVNFQLDKTAAIDIYTNLRDRYDSVIIPAMQDGLKATTANYLASELVTRREDAKSAFQSLLQSKLVQYHIIILSVSITNFNFSQQFQQAIDNKVTTEQNALAAQNQLAVVQYQAQQQVINASAYANATIQIAQGNAQAKIIGAQAQATLQALLNENMTTAYLQYVALLQWNGVLPYYYGSTAPLPFLNVNSTSTNSTIP